MNGDDAEVFAVADVELRRKDGVQASEVQQSAGWKSSVRRLQSEDFERCCMDIAEVVRREEQESKVGDEGVKKCRLQKMKRALDELKVAVLAGRAKLGMLGILGMLATVGGCSRGRWVCT